MQQVTLGTIDPKVAIEQFSKALKRGLPTATKHANVIEVAKEARAANQSLSDTIASAAFVAYIRAGTDAVNEALPTDLFKRAKDDQGTYASFYGSRNKGKRVAEFFTNGNTVSVEDTVYNMAVIGALEMAALPKLSSLYAAIVSFEKEAKDQAEAEAKATGDGIAAAIRACRNGHKDSLNLSGKMLGIMSEPDASADTITERLKDEFGRNGLSEIVRAGGVYHHNIEQAADREAEQAEQAEKVINSLSDWSPDQLASLMAHAKKIMAEQVKHQKVA